MESRRIVTVRIEVSRGDLVKRSPSGSTEFISLLPCPFNYGSVHAETGGDGDPLDALVLGPRIERGQEISLPVQARVRFVDAGLVDDKLICSQDRPGLTDRLAVLAFFEVYARAKRAAYLLRRVRGDTMVLGWVWSDREDSP